MKPHAQRILDAVRTINDLALLRQDALRRLAASLDFKGDPLAVRHLPGVEWFAQDATLRIRVRYGQAGDDICFNKFALVDGHVIVDSLVAFLVKDPDDLYIVLLDFDKRVSPSEDIRSIARAKWGADLKVTLDLDLPWYMAEGARVYISAETSSDFDYVDLADCAPIVHGEQAAFLIKGRKGHEIYVLDLNKKVAPR